jgi:pimeloyl-ACP methyl ester carboxylesterase
MIDAAVPVRAGHWLDWGGSGAPLHFAHGNGFPPATYRKLIEVLRSGCHVASMEARPLWPDSDPRSLTHWSQLARDLIQELDRRGMRGSVGVGHSLGAVTTLLAAAEDPRLFKAVVAIDPVILSGWTSILWGTMKTSRTTGHTLAISLISVFIILLLPLVTIIFGMGQNITYIDSLCVVMDCCY